MKRLIVNADDFGQTRGVNAGIVQAHRQGIVTSTTLMANGAAFGDAVIQVQRCSDLAVGVHLNVVEGNPVAPRDQVASLLRRDGRLLAKGALVRRHLRGRLSMNELALEIGMQIDRVCDAGIEPTHVDSHQHIHAYPPFFETFAAAARSRGIRAIRVPYERSRWRDQLSLPAGALRMTAVNALSVLSRRTLSNTGLVAAAPFAGTLRTGRLTVDWLIDWLRRVPEGTAELMVHPGHCDGELLQSSTRLLASREAELAVLVDPRVLAAIAELRIQLVSYRDLTMRTAPSDGGAIVDGAELSGQSTNGRIASSVAEATDHSDRTFTGN